jgi:hypothetical protein
MCRFRLSQSAATARPHNLQMVPVRDSYSGVADGGRPASGRTATGGPPAKSTPFEPLPAIPKSMKSSTSPSAVIARLFGPAVTVADGRSPFHAAAIQPLSAILARHTVRTPRQAPAPVASARLWRAIIARPASGLSTVRMISAGFLHPADLVEAKYQVRFVRMIEGSGQCPRLPARNAISRVAIAKPRQRVEDFESDRGRSRWTAASHVVRDKTVAHTTRPQDRRRCPCATRCVDGLRSGRPRAPGLEQPVKNGSPWVSAAKQLDEPAQ